VMCHGEIIAELSAANADRNQIGLLMAGVRSDTGVRS